MPQPIYVDNYRPASAYRAMRSLKDLPPGPHSGEPGYEDDGAPSMRQHVEAILAAGRLLIGMSAEDYSRVARHEAAHATMGLACGWDVLSCDVHQRRTQVEPPPYLDQSAEDRAWQWLVITAAAEALTGPSQHEHGADRSMAREHAYAAPGGATFDDAVVEVRRRFNDDPTIREQIGRA